MVSAWTGKRCAGCDGKKGAKYLDKKYCGRCAIKVRQNRSRGAHARAIQARYGLSPEDYDRLYAVQGGRCYICRRATGRTRRLSVDHDHITGRVRGLLCRPCNTLLGHARDDAEFFIRAIEYLKNPPFDTMDKAC